MIYVIIAVVVIVVVALLTSLTLYNFNKGRKHDRRLVAIDKLHKKQASSMAKISTDINYNDKVLNDTQAEIKGIVDQRQDEMFRYLKREHAKLREELTVANMEKYIDVRMQEVLAEMVKQRETVLKQMVQKHNELLVQMNKYVANDNFQKVTAKLNADLDTLSKVVQGHVISLRDNIIPFISGTNKRISDVEKLAFDMKKDADKVLQAQEALRNTINTTAYDVNTLKEQIKNLTQQIISSTTSEQAALSRALLLALVANADGNVGLGTRTPAARLHIKGTKDTRVRIEGSPATLELGNDEVGGFSSITSDGNKHLHIRTDDAKNVYMQDGGAKNTGNVIIGNVNATSHKLLVGGTIGIANANELELGVGMQKEANAGKVAYKKFSDSLDVVGAGENAQNRKIKFWNEGGAEFVGPMNVQGCGLRKQGNRLVSSCPIAAGSESTVPIGAIIMWSGTAVPDGWALCDGTSYNRSDGSGQIRTPDLRGRFIVGTGQGDGLSNRPLGQSGGSEAHRLTVAELPPHSHPASSDVAGWHNHGMDGAGHHTHTYSDAYFAEHRGWGQRLPGSRNWYDHDNDEFARDKTTAGAGHHAHGIHHNGNHAHNIRVNDTGGNQPHNNMPPFYALALIMKV